MRRICLVAMTLALAGALPCAGLSARRAAPKRAAVLLGWMTGPLPDPVLARNNAVIRDALRANLGSQGLQVAGEQAVARALAQCGLSAGQRLWAPQLARVRAALGVDYLVYYSGRVGVEPFGRKGFHTVVMLNVGGSSSRDYFHSYQAHADFAPDGFRTVDDTPAEKIVLDRAGAGKLAGTLLAGFYRKLARDGG